MTAPVIVAVDEGGEGAFEIAGQIGVNLQG
jgi:hypothetical protein